MSKRGRATYTARAHGNPNSKIHARDKISQEERKARHAKGRFVFVEGYHEGQKYPPFESEFPKLGNGYCWQVVRSKDGKVAGIEPVEGETWEQKLAEQTASLSWYHQWQERQGKDGSWRKRKIKDRAKLTARDRRERPDSDVERATFELRPDHSRAVQYLLEAGREEEVRKLLLGARVKKCQLFEEIYGRTVTYGAEHGDSGQHHDDLWHDGIKEVADDSIRKTGIRRERTLHREYGVGPGVSAWARHENVLRIHCLLQGKDHREVMGKTVDAIEQSTAKAEEQNGTPPRDLEFYKQLDNWMGFELAILDMATMKRATSEYAEHLIKGYEQGLLGFVRKETPRETKLRGRVEELEAQVSELRARETEIEKALPEKAEGAPDKPLPERVAEVTAEARKLPGIREAAQGILSSLSKGLPAIREAVGKLVALVGLTLPKAPTPSIDEQKMP
ncbi:MAG: hypothetical protein BGO12_21370 [Verrucomicrobia bacterium 61-8]|nr:hypothetical protein [Verrucomicrobiota bacterium]OJU98045.1 MAG: hypothetical protein BGO12_21370 [Verrucomicrobia bacterium 61-8]